MQHLRLAALICATLLVGCGLRDESVIDGWRIGAEVRDCVGRTFTPSCDQLIAAARTALDARDGPLRAAIVSVTLHYQDNAPIRTIVSIVAVFDLADGSRRAIFTSSSVGASVTMDYGP